MPAYRQAGNLEAEQKYDGDHHSSDIYHHRAGGKSSNLAA
jgi:hypothetical protein